MHPTQRPPPGPPVGPIADHREYDVRPLPSDDSRLWALLAHVAPIASSFVGPLAIWLVKRNDDPFASYHAAQAFWFSILTLVLVSLSCGFGSVLLPIFWLYGVYTGLKAKEGSYDGYPLVSGMGQDGGLT